MNRCVAITKKGDRCKNHSKTASLCHIHSKQLEVKPKEVKPKEVKLKEVKLKEVKLKEVKLKQIFNPYYNKNVLVDGFDNCSDTRKSLERFNPTQSNIAFATSYCDVLPLKNIKYIVGPIAYNEFRYGKYNIGLFGEFHMIRVVPKDLTNKSTVNFSSFLTSVVMQNPKQFDFFLEMYFKSRQYPEKMVNDLNTIFNLLSVDFKDCLSISKSCPFKNLRAHYVDYRSVSDIDDNVATRIYQGIANWLGSDRSGHMSDYLNSTEIQDLIENAVERYKEVVKKIDKIIKNDKKLNKQLDNNPLKIQILKFIKISQQGRLEKFVEYLERNRMAEFDIKTMNTRQALILIDFALLFIGVYSNLMDIYTLARMFRTFHKTPTDDPENIIVYSGNLHADRYNKFLDHIKAEKIIEIKGNTNDMYIEFSEENKRKSFLFN